MPKTQICFRSKTHNTCIPTMMHIYRTHLQPDIVIYVKGKKETGVISLTHNYRGIWGEERERVKIRWAVFLCAGQHADSPMPSWLLPSQAERRCGIWTRASPVFAHIPKAGHKWRGQLPVYFPCTSTQLRGQRATAFVFYRPTFCWALHLLSGLIKSPQTNTTFFSKKELAFLSCSQTLCNMYYIIFQSSIYKFWINNFWINKSTGFNLLSKPVQTNQKGKAIIKTRKQAMSHAIYKCADVSRGRIKS